MEIEFDWVLEEPTEKKTKPIQYKPIEQESNLRWTGRNLLQTPGLTISKMLGAPVDVGRRLKKEWFGESKEDILRRDEPEKLEEGLQAARKVAEQFGYMSPRQMDEAMEQARQGITLPGTQEIMGSLPFGLGATREGDWLSHYASNVLPFLATPQIATLPGLLRQGLLAGTTLGGGYLGGTAGRAIGQEFGKPETGEILGGFLGGTAGMKVGQKAHGYLKKLPTNVFPEMIDTKYDSQELAVRDKYDKQRSSMADKHVGSTDELNKKFALLNKQFESDVSVINIERNKLKQRTKKEVDKITSERESLSEQIEGYENISSEFYDKVDNKINNIHGGDIRIEVPGLLKKTDGLKEKYIPATTEAEMSSIIKLIEKTEDLVRDGKASFRKLYQASKMHGKRSYKSEGFLYDAAKDLRGLLQDEIYTGLKPYRELRSEWGEGIKYSHKQKDLARNRIKIEKSLTAKANKLNKDLGYVISEDITPKQQDIKKQYIADTDAIKAEQKALKAGGIEQQKMLKASEQTELDWIEKQRVPVPRTHAEKFVDGIARQGIKWAPRSIGAGIIEGITYALGLPAGTRHLLSLGGGLVGEALRQFKVLRSVLKNHPDLHKSYIAAVKQLQKGHPQDLVGLIPRIASRADAEQSDEFEWVLDED